jgi:hypothetical protein
MRWLKKRAQRPAPRGTDTSDQERREKAASSGDDDLDDWKAPVRTLDGVGSLLAANIVDLLNLRRRRQQSRRQPGQRIALPGQQVEKLEIALRGVADPEGRATIQRILESLTHDLATSGHLTLSIEFARWSPPRLELYLIDDISLPAPWERVPGERAWVNATHAAAATGSSVTSYPTWVTIGHDDEDRAVLVHLEGAKSLSIDGDIQASQQVIAAGAVELGTAPYATDTTVVLVGGWSELVHVLEPGRARYIPTLADYVPSDGREVLFLAQAPGPGSQALHAASEHAAAMIYPGTGGALSVAVDEVSVLQPFGVPLRLQTLNPTDYALVVEDLATSMIGTLPRPTLRIVPDRLGDTSA